MTCGVGYEYEFGGLEYRDTTRLRAFCDYYVQQLTIYSSGLF